MSFANHMSNQSHFATVPKVGINRSVFNRSHGHKTTIRADYLYPVYLDEVLPGDTFSLDLTALGRLATPIAPIMDNLYLDTFFFFVPNRLIWENWVKMMGEKEDPEDETEYVVPKITGAVTGDDTLWDHFGCPDIDPNTLTIGDGVSALPFRAYTKVYQDWFRDQNLIAAPFTTWDDGPDNTGEHNIQKRSKRHDYFTSATPWPQKGDSVELPLGTTAPVVGDGLGLGLVNGVNDFGITPVSATGGYALMASFGAYNNDVGEAVSTSSVSDLKVVGVTQATGESGMVVDLSEATAATINSLREAFQLQRMLERDARSGTRYVETILAHFQVQSPDFRLQRSEYLGGNSIPINVTPVQQNAEGENTPLGTLGGYGTVVHRAGFNKSFTEHGFVIGLANLRSAVTYQQGLNRMFNRSTKYDFAWPALAHLGEQEVYNREIYFQGEGAEDDTGIFGYQERYAEYRYSPSIISGDLRSTRGLSLDVWHLAEEFDELPVLSQEFIEANTPMSRVLAVPGEQDEMPHMILDMYIRLKCARPLPTYGVPGLIDHF